MHYLCQIFLLLFTFRVSVCSPDCCLITSKGEEVHVSCRGCGLDSVPEDLPLNTSVLDLANNQIHTLNETSFSSLRRLNNVTVASNILSYISAGTFEGLHNLRYLYLSGNHLNGSLGASVFKSLTNLRVLHIQGNHFHVTRSYPEKALSVLSNLENLYIDIFEGFSFGNGFLKLTKLTILQFDRYEGEVMSIRNSSFLGLGMSNISQLKLDAPIRKIEIDSLSHFPKLTSLTFDSGKFLTIREFLQSLYGLRGRTMDTISAENNYMTYDKHIVDLKISDMIYIKTICLKNLSLRKNKIGSIEMRTILSWTRRDCLEVLDVSENAILSPQLLTLLPLFPSLTHVYGSLQYTKSLRRKRRYFSRKRTLFLPHSLIYINVSHDRFDDHLKTFQFNKGNSLRYLDFSYPQNVRCDGGRISGMVYLTNLYVSGLHCSQPNPQMFADMINLTRLEARQCNFGDYLSVNSTLFRGLHNLTFVDLSANNIQTLEPTTFNDQSESLSTLLLSGNRIERLPVPVLESLNVLEMLDVTNNLISTLLEFEYTALDRLQLKSRNLKVNLNGNPIVCNCDNLDFLRWISTSTLIYEKQNLPCSSSDGNRHQLGNILELFENMQESCIAFSWLIVSVVLIVIFSVAVTLVLVSWRHSPRIRVWCRHPRQCKRTHMVCVSYSDDDSSFARMLCDTLEKEGISCWCYDRDFTPGVDIAENIMDAIDSCHKSVFVVSYSWIHSEWLQFAMQVARRYSLRDGRESDNIVILLDDIRLSEMPKLIRKIWDQIVRLKWPNENSTDTMEIAAKRGKFWKTLSNKIRKGIPTTTVVPANTQAEILFMTDNVQ